MTSSRRFVLVLVILAVAGGLGAAGFAAGLPFRGAALEHLPKLFSPEARELGQIVLTSHQEYRSNAVRWSGVYFGCVFGSALCSALAALLLKLDALSAWPRLRNDLAAGLATLAALLVTLSTTGNFQRKWQANRLAASAMENLAYELIRPHPSVSPDEVIARIQAVNAARNEGIVGTEVAEERRPPTDSKAQPSRVDVPPSPAPAGEGKR